MLKETNSASSAQKLKILARRQGKAQGIMGISDVIASGSMT